MFRALQLGVAGILISGVLVVQVVLAVQVSELKPTGLVVDQAQVVSEDEEARVTTLVQKINSERNAEGTVVIVDNLGGQDSNAFSVDVFRKFGIGNKQTNNGFLVLVAIQDRETRLTTGYGLEGVLTDLRSAAIARLANDQFRAGDYGGGLVTILNAVDGVLANDPETISKLDQNTQGWPSEDIWILIVSLAIFALPWLAAIFSRSREWWAGGVVGAVGGSTLGIFFGWVWIGLVGVFALGFLGLLFDWMVSRSFQNGKFNKSIDWWAGGNNDWFFDSQSGGGGFGGFGGGSTGGGGGGSKW